MLHMYLKRNPTTGDFLGSIPEVASTVVALGSRGWLREAAQVALGKCLKREDCKREGEGIWGCFLFCRCFSLRVENRPAFSPFWLGISVVK